MTKKIICIAAFCGILFGAYGQPSLPCSCDSLLEKIRKPQLTGDFYINPIPGKVSQFFSDDWLSGSVLLFNKVTVPVKYLKYNGYIDHLITLSKNFTQIKLDSEPILSFSLSDKTIPETYLFEKIRLSAGQVRDSLVFAQMLYKGPLSLYVVRKVVKTGNEEIPGSNNLTDAFEKRNIYFFTEGNKVIREFRKISKKTILEIFPSEKESISRMIRSQKKSRIRTEDDLIRFTEWLNSFRKQE
jgi:hypothetical protein